MPGRGPDSPFGRPSLGHVFGSAVVSPPAAAAPFARRKKHSGIDNHFGCLFVRFLVSAGGGPPGRPAARFPSWSAGLLLGGRSWAARGVLPDVAGSFVRLLARHGRFRRISGGAVRGAVGCVWGCFVRFGGASFDAFRVCCGSSRVAPGFGESGRNRPGRSSFRLGMSRTLLASSRPVGEPRGWLRGPRRPRRPQ